MTDIAAISNNGDHTRKAPDLRSSPAVREEHDFGGLARRRAVHRGRRPRIVRGPGSGETGSWEADLVRNLVKGTIGWDDEYLADHKEPL